MARFKIWRKSASAVEVPSTRYDQVRSASPPLPISTALPGSFQAHLSGSSAPNIITDHLKDQTPSRQPGPTTRSTPQANSNPTTAPPRWTKVPAGHANGPWGEGFRTFKPPHNLAILQTDTHNPQSPLAWFIDQLGIPILRIIPRKGIPPVTFHCEYELGNLNISPSIGYPPGYREPFMTKADFAEGSWRNILIFTTPMGKNPVRMTRACEAINEGFERITVSFKVTFLETNEDDQYVRMSYEEASTYRSFEASALEDFYAYYGHVLTRTIEEHRAAREFYIGPWMAEGRSKEKTIPSLLEKSKNFLRVDGDAEKTRSREMKEFEMFGVGMESEVGEE